MNDQPRAPSIASPDPVESIAVREADLTVEKSIVPYQDDVVKVGFTISSECDEPVLLRLVDQLPAQIEAENVGFHPDYDPDAWGLDGGRTVVYESRIEPGRERETVYGARVGSIDQLEEFAVQPTVELAPAVRNGVESDGGDRAERRDDRASGVDTHPVTVGNDSGARTVPDPAEPADGVDGASDSPSQGAGGEPSNAGTKYSLETDEPIVDSLLDELRAGELTAAERAVLREELGLDTTSSEQVRLGRVKESIDDLLAYRDALEGFIDEHGPAEEIIEECRASFADHAADIDRIETAVDDVRSTLESLEVRHDRDTEHVKERLATIETELNANLGALTDELDAVQTHLTRVETWRERVIDAAQLVDAGGRSDSAPD